MMSWQERVDLAVRVRQLPRSGATAAGTEHVERILNLGQTWMPLEDASAVVGVAEQLGLEVYAVRFLAPSMEGPVEMLQAWAGTSATPDLLPMALCTEWRGRPLVEQIGRGPVLLRAKNTPEASSAAS